MKYLAASLLLLLSSLAVAEETAPGGATGESSPAQMEEFASTCKIRSLTLIDKLTGGTSVAAAAKAIAGAKPKLVAVGESHGGYALRQIPTLLSELKKQMPDLDCLFVEFPETAKKDLLAVQSGNLKDIDDGRIIERSDTYATAQKLGVRVIPVDDLGGRGMIWPGVFDPKGPQPPWQITTEGANARDENILGGIQHHMTQTIGRCHRGLLIIGKAHLINVAGPGRNTLTERLKKNGISVKTINMLNPGPMATGERFPEWNWPVCRENPTAPKEPVAFASRDLASDVTLFPKMAPFNEFDWTIVYPDRPFQSLMTPAWRANQTAKLKKVLPPEMLEAPKE